MERLSEEQRAAALVEGGPTLVVAGPGTGKTACLVARFLHLAGAGRVPPPAILALTFTRRSADDLLSRILRGRPDLDPEALAVGTFHKLCRRLLGRLLPAAGGQASFHILDDAEQLAALRRLAPAWPEGEIAELRHGIARLQERLVDPPSFRAGLEEREHRGEEPSDLESRLADAYEAYEGQKTARNQLDFDGLAFTAVRILEAQPDLCRSIAQGFRHVLTVVGGR